MKYDFIYHIISLIINLQNEILIKVKNNKKI